MQLRHGIIGLALLVFVGCVTIPSTGSRVWYDQRMVEIETAYQNGELTEEQYLDLKNQSDQIRVDYQSALRDRRYYYPDPFFYSPFFHHGHHFSHHHHGHHR